MQAHTLWLLVLGLLLAVANSTEARQFVVLDEDYIHTKWYYHFAFAESQPDNWQAPANYAEGTAYVRCEVRRIKTPILGTNKTTGEQTEAKYWCPQICLFQDRHSSDKHACFSSALIKIDQPGVYRAQASMAKIGMRNNIDFSRKLLNPMVIGKTQEPYARSYGNSTRDGVKYNTSQDVDMRIGLIVVAKGDAFDPPGWWGSDSTGGGTSGIGTQEGTGSGGTTESGTTGGGGTTGGTATGDGGSTGGSGLIALWSPLGGEILEAGSTHEIVWTSTGDISAVTIEVSADGGATWQTVAGSTENDGNYAWKVPTQPGDTYLVRVSDPGDPVIFATSLSSFGIQDASSNASSPGQTTATALGDGGGSCGAVILLAKGGGTLPTDGRHGWFLPWLTLLSLYVWRRAFKRKLASTGLS